MPTVFSVAFLIFYARRLSGIPTSGTTFQKVHPVLCLGSNSLWWLVLFNWMAACNNTLNAIAHVHLSL